MTLTDAAEQVDQLHLDGTPVLAGLLREMGIEYPIAYVGGETETPSVEADEPDAGEQADETDGVGGPSVSPGDESSSGEKLESPGGVAACEGEPTPPTNFAPPVGEPVSVRPPRRRRWVTSEPSE